MQQKSRRDDNAKHLVKESKTLQKRSTKSEQKKRKHLNRVVQFHSLCCFWIERFIFKAEFSLKSVDLIMVVDVVLIILDGLRLYLLATGHGRHWDERGAAASSLQTRPLQMLPSSTAWRGTRWTLFFYLYPSIDSSVCYFYDCRMPVSDRAVPWPSNPTVRLLSFWLHIQPPSFLLNVVIIRRIQQQQQQKH